MKKNLEAGYQMLIMVLNLYCYFTDIVLFDLD